MLNIQKIKQDFPIFQSNPDLVYLDSTATSLKPQSVIDSLTQYYNEYSANIHRGIYQLSEKATAEYEATRQIIADFIHAKSADEVIFTRNTTESLNLIAYSLGRNLINPGDEVVTTIMEHHSNFVPWQQLITEDDAVLKIIGVDEEGKLDLGIKPGDQKANTQALGQIITKKTKLLAITYISNVLGTINPIKDIIASAKAINPHIIVVVDSAQAIQHLPIDVQDLGCDFLAFSSHKMLGPTGVGVLWGKYELLDEMTPFMFGGEMVLDVNVDQTEFKKPPHKFEAGTPHIAGVIALKEAVKYIQSIGFGAIQEHDQMITEHALRKMTETFGKTIKLLGPQNLQDRIGIVAFEYSKYHPHDIAQILDENNIAIRAGHHCAMPLHKHIGASATARASFYLYNNTTDVDTLIEGLKKVERTLK